MNPRLVPADKTTPADPSGRRGQGRHPGMDLDALERESHRPEVREQIREAIRQGLIRAYPDPDDHERLRLERVEAPDRDA